MSLEKNVVTDHLANERTYLAWLRTRIAIIALGFVVAKFGLIVRELVPLQPETSFHFSSIIGITCHSRWLNGSPSIEKVHAQSAKNRGREV